MYCKTCSSELDAYTYLYANCPTHCRTILSACIDSKLFSVMISAWKEEFGDSFYVSAKSAVMHKANKLFTQ